jgi:hypothetical protein
VAVSGLQASTATYFVPSVSCAFPGHSRSEVSGAPRLAPSRLSITTCRAPMCLVGTELPIRNVYTAAFGGDPDN